MKSIIKQKFLTSALVRIILGLIICMAALIIGQQIFVHIPGVTTLSADLRNPIKGLFVSTLLISSYRLFYGKIEKRKITELATLKGGLKNLFFGVISGASLQALTMLVIFLFGSFKIIAVNSITSLIIPFTVAFTVAILEEVLLRGIVFRIAEEKLGSVKAIIISSIIFAGLHVFNPHITLISVLCILAVGVLLSAAYMYYRSLWLPIAFHFAWNFTQNGIFGAITSGNEKTDSLFSSIIGGPEVLTGGLFGPEGSLQAFLFCAIAAVWVIIQLYKQHKILKPKISLFRSKAAYQTGLR